MYYGFKDEADIISQFDLKMPPRLLWKRMIAAVYDTPPYEGYALVIFEGHDGKLYEVNASHCSCSGLEEGWNPEETTWDAIEQRLVAGNPWWGESPCSGLDWPGLIQQERGK